MANFRSIYVIPVFIFYFINLSQALYEDQVGKFDWKRSFIGKVKYASFEGKRIIVATEQNVLASLSVKNGQIAWRHVLENPKEHEIQLLDVDKEIVTVSGTLNSWVVRGWELVTGILLWEWTLFADKAVHSEWVIWKGQLIHITSVIGSHTDIAFYHLQTGDSKNRTVRIPTPWIRDFSQCVLTHTFYMCLSSNDVTGLLYYIDVSSESNTVQAKAISELIGDAPGTIQLITFEYEKPAVLIQKNNMAKLLIFQDDSVKVTPYNLLSNAVAIQVRDSYDIYQLDVNVDNKEKILKVIKRGLVSNNQEEVDVEYPLGLGAPYIVTGYCKGSLCDLLLNSNDNALLLLRLPEGKTLWTREEALSNIVSVEFFELPVSELDASIENEFKSVSDDVVSMFLHRLSTQAKQLSSLLFGNQLLSKSGLVRDEFGLHKIIVVATNVGKLFGIDTISGSIVWSYRLPNVKPFQSFNMEIIQLFVQRTARYSPFPAQCLLLAEDSATGEGVLFQFDPITGLPSQEAQRLGYKVKQAMLLPYENEEHLKPVIILATNGNLHIYPDNAKNILHSHAKSVYLYTVDTTKSLITGYGVDKDIDAFAAWDLNFAPARIVSISTRSPSERLHSQGRVLPDRSVYYKYVNPNLIAVATLNDDPVHKHVLNVYLIDGITGLILYSASHKRAKGPIHLVHSENWMVYTYFSERFRRTEIASAELYEGEVQSNSTAFSSYTVSQLPRILSQSYILPATVQTLAVTLTERGITNKFILAALTSGAVTEIPWMILEPRIPDIPCGPEDGCIPYMPEIPIVPEANINYNQTLIRAKGIQVAPARLESTCHVLVYGLDMFYTRVAPSKTFDVLKEDFDHKLIVLVLSGLIVASYVTKQLASRKALRQAWK